MTKGKTTAKVPTNKTVIAAPAEEIVKQLENLVEVNTKEKAETAPKLGVIDWSSKGDMPYYLL